GFCLVARGIEFRRFQRAEGVDATFSVGRAIARLGRYAHDNRHDCRQDGSRVHRLPSETRFAITDCRRPYRWQYPSWPSESPPADRPMLATLLESYRHRLVRLCIAFRN